MKCLHQVCSRLDDDTVEEIDREVRERTRAALQVGAAPLTRSLVVRQILAEWCEGRRSERAASRGARA